MGRSKRKLRLRNYDAEVAQELNEMEKKEDLAEYFKQYLNGEISKDELDIKVDSLDVDSSLIHDAKKEVITDYHNMFYNEQISKADLLEKCDEIELDDSIKNVMENSKNYSEKQLARSRQVLTSEMVDKINNTFDATGAMKSRVATSSTSGMVWGLTQVTQSNHYYCGPATAKMIIDDAISGTVSQGTCARSLGTTSAGTAWRSNGSYPMRNTLNSLIGTNFYAAYSAGTNDVSKLTGKVTSTINSDWGIAANIYSPAYGTYRLPGYPANKTIEHWIAIDGYYDRGNTIHYADPAYGAGSVSWSGNITSPYSNVSATAMAYLIWERGIVY